MTDPHSSQAATPRQLSLRVGLDDDARLDNFFVPNAESTAARVRDYLKSNILRWRQSGRALSGSTRVKDFCWLWGSEGAGCSHLLQAVCHAASSDEAAPNQHVLSAFYLDLSLSDLHPDILDGLESQDILCLDHLQQVVGKPAWDEALFHLYNRLAHHGGALLVAADNSPQHVQVSLPDLRSRLQSAAVFQLPVLADTDKVAALQMRARLRGFNLGDDVAEFLVRRNQRSMAALFGVLQALDRHSLETGRRVTIPLLKSLMGW